MKDYYCILGGCKFYKTILNTSDVFIRSHYRLTHKILDEKDLDVFVKYSLNGVLKYE